MAFCVATYGMISQQEWWRSTSVVASAISIVGLVLFWRNPVSSSVFFALAVDIIIIIALVAMHWPSDEVIGA